MGKSAELFMQIQDELLHTQNQVVNGELSNLEALIQMRKAKDGAETVLEIVKSYEDEHFSSIANEAEKYGGKYKGFEIKAISGKRTYSFSGIPEYEEVNQQLKQVQDKYKTAFEGFQKGTVQTTEENGQRYWIDDSGQINPFPELKISKSYLTIKPLKSN